ncbi:hypothetical protein PIB30_009646 [Stylosanthes scabra]|uniref:Uncharacterized protein n=1 Tax=Stylosanthes scabra TaxID=79078 RepID=A0ABU6T572_9FABA|nr:hypothetical protein [Stylosanthes scabra]
MAEPPSHNPENNHISNHHDGQTTSDSASYNQPRDINGCGGPWRQPSPRRARPQQHNSPLWEAYSRPTHYEIIDLMNGHNGRLDQLELELAQQREVERKLQDELQEKGNGREDP